jgi:hypothetical protein
MSKVPGFYHQFVTRNKDGVIQDSDLPNNTSISELVGINDKSVHDLSFKALLNEISQALDHDDPNSDCCCGMRRPKRTFVLAIFGNLPIFCGTSRELSDENRSIAL